MSLSKNVKPKIEYVTSTLLDRQGVKHGFFKRHGGVSSKPTGTLNVKVSKLVPDSIASVSQNLERALKSGGFADKKVALLYLEGRDNVIKLRHLDGSQTIYEADGVVTDQPNAALAITVADCLPILLFDPSKHVIGIAHAGWQGTHGCVASKVVSMMIDEFGCAPADIVAAIGPSICVRHYEVKDDVARLFPAEFIQKREQKLWLDLWAVNEQQLKATGVTQIDNLQVCTYENTDDFYSTRGEGATGRFLALISLSEPAPQ